MSTTIDIENAKSIRSPMNIRITFSVSTGGNLSFTHGSGSYAPLYADLTNIEKSWTWLKPADLSLRDGDSRGIPLDNSCVAFDENMTPSYANGRWGIVGRCPVNSGVISFSVYVTGTSDIAYLYIETENCQKIRCNSVYYYDDGSGIYRVIVNDENATLHFYSTGVGRVLCKTITATETFEYDESDLISCKLNLRSDLKPIDPTLPESEIEFEVYEPDDMSMYFRNIATDMPITYSAGYDNDMSPERKFYLSDRITWKDSVLTIKGVDAVHLLDQEVEPFLIGEYGLNYTSATYGQGTGFPASVNGHHWRLYSTVWDHLQIAGVNLISTETAPPYNARSVTTKGTLISSLIADQTRRELIANMMNLLHQEYSQGEFTFGTQFWLNYVDAGRPTLSWSKPTSKWDIYEADCGDIVKDIGRDMNTITAKANTLTFTRGYTNLGRVGPLSIGKYYCQVVGSGTEIDADSETFAASFDGYGIFWGLGVRRDSHQEQKDDIIVYAGNYRGSSSPGSTALLRRAGINGAHGWYGTELLHEDIIRDDISSSSDVRPFYLEAKDNDFHDTANNNSVNSIDILGDMIEVGSEKKTFNSGKGLGSDEECNTTGWVGQIGTQATQILPAYGIMSLFKRSTETGSFTWKGDPRVQPRDVFTFHFLDGTTELRTIESIEMTHDGGTVATITYRKGIV